MITVFTLKYSYDEWPPKSHENHQEQFYLWTYSSITLQENLTIFSLSLKESGHPFPESVNDPRKWIVGHESTHFQRQEETGQNGLLLLCVDTQPREWRLCCWNHMGIIIFSVQVHLHHYCSQSFSYIFLESQHETLPSFWWENPTISSTWCIWNDCSKFHSMQFVLLLIIWPLN